MPPPPRPSPSPSPSSHAGRVATRRLAFGGVGALVVVAVWAVKFPALRDVDRFDEVRTGD